MTALAILAPRRFWRLLISDAMSVGRDPVLIIVTVASIAAPAAFVAFRGAINDAAFDAFGLANLGGYVAPLVLLLPALLIGWVSGFLFLEDRDEGMLVAIDITPAGKAGFFAYRMTITAAIVFLVVLLAVVAVVPEAGAVTGVVLALSVAAEAVMVAALLPLIARNKVEGLALSKVLNFALLVPLAAVAPTPWRYLAAVVPSYWIGELLAVSGVSYLTPTVVLALAVGIHIVAGAAVVQRSMRASG